MQAPITTISQLGSHEGQAVTIRGWLYNLRESGKLLFPIIRDGTGLVQGVVVKSKVAPEVWDALKGLTQESALIVSGQVRADKRAPGGYELEVETAEVVQRVPEGDPYPITLKEHGVDFLMEHRHLWMRTPRQAAILRTRAEIINAVRDYLNQNGYTLADPPILTPAACEGTTTLFPVNYFEEQAYLTQSGQLYNEAAAMALGKVYSFGPTFRAEKSKTRRHLTEFWMVEPEVAYYTLDDIMELAENFVTYIVKRCLERRRADLETMGRNLAPLEKIDTPFPRISYDDAVAMLHEGHAKGELESRFEYGNDFGSPDETYISSKFDRPLMVHRYPAAVKAFYMEPDPLDADQGALRRRARSRGLRRNHRRLAARRQLRTATAADSPAPVAGRGFPVVSRSAQVRRCAALGLRHGHRARRGLGLRIRSRKGDDSVRAHAAQNVSVNRVS